jgi:hypothetical protein
MAGTSPVMTEEDKFTTGPRFARTGGRLPQDEAE